MDENKSFNLLRSFVIVAFFVSLFSFMLGYALVNYRPIPSGLAGVLFSNLQVTWPAFLYIIFALTAALKCKKRRNFDPLSIFFSPLFAAALAFLTLFLSRIIFGFGNF